MYGLLAFCAAIVLTTFDVAFAQGPNMPRAPAPLIGLGLPIAGCVLAAVWLARRWRQKD